MLEDNIDILTATEALLERETLDAPEVQLLMNGEPLPPVVEQNAETRTAVGSQSVFVTKHSDDKTKIVGIPETDPDPKAHNLASARSFDRLTSLVGTKRETRHCDGYSKRHA